MMRVVSATTSTTQYMYIAFSHLTTAITLVVCIRCGHPKLFSEQTHAWPQPFSVPSVPSACTYQLHPGGCPEQLIERCLFLLMI